MSCSCPLVQEDEAELQVPLGGTAQSRLEAPKVSRYVCEIAAFFVLGVTGGGPSCAALLLPVLL